MYDVLRALLCGGRYYGAILTGDHNTMSTRSVKVGYNNIALEEMLAAQYFVSGLDEHQRHRLLQASIRRSLDVDEHLFHRDDSANYFFVVLSGRIKLYRLSADGDEKILGLSGTHATFAEGVLFMQQPVYPVNAQALEKSEVVGLDRETYLAILRESFPTCLSVMAEVTGRIQGLLNEIESLTLRDSRYRVVNFLVNLLPQTTQGTTNVQLPARKSAIAARLSIRPETLSRAFRLLNEEGLISMRDSHVIIHDPDALRDIVKA